MKIVVFITVNKGNLASWPEKGMESEAQEPSSCLIDKLKHHIYRPHSTNILLTFIFYHLDNIINQHEIKNGP